MPVLYIQQKFSDTTKKGRGRNDPGLPDEQICPNFLSENNVQGIDQSRDEPEQRQDHTDPELLADAAVNSDPYGRQNDGQNDLYDACA